MNNTENKDMVALKPINLKRLYKSRKYENLFLSSVFICKLAILINMLAICIRVYLGYINNLVEPYEIKDWGTLFMVVILHVLIIVYALSSIKSLKERT